MQIIADLHVHSKYSRAVSPEMTLPKMAGWGRKKGINLLGTGDFTHPLWFLEIKANLAEAGEGIYGLKNATVIPTDPPIRRGVEESSVARAGFGLDPSTSLGMTSNTVTGSLEKGDASLLRRNNPFFLLSTEISSIYSQGGKLRRIHNVVLAPSMETVEKINNELIKRGCNLHSDGRPIIGISAKDLVKIILEIDERSLIIPAHAWTPWFSVYGSQSGFDSLEECFGETAKYIYGVETGLSSDPAMNWRILDLKKRSLLSSSDAHSGPKLGREATVFEMEEMSYENIRKAIIQSSVFGYQLSDGGQSVVSLPAGGPKTDKPVTENRQQKTDNRIAHTLEFYPEEGKYHYTGHRACGVKQTPEETRRLGTTCPTCGRKLTVGVMHRVEQLAVPETRNSLFGKKLAQSKQLETRNDENGVKWISQISPIGQIGGHPPYAMLVPLQEIIAESLGTVPASIKVQNEYNKLIAAFAESSGEPKGEFGVLLKTPISEIAKIAGEKIAEGVKKVRNGDISVDPGYDGVFGVVKIWPSSPADSAGSAGQGVDKDSNSQMSMF